MHEIGHAGRPEATNHRWGKNRPWSGIPERSQCRKPHVSNGRILSPTVHNIAGYETRLDPGRLGLGVTAFVHVSMEKGYLSALRKFTDGIRSLPEVMECFSVTGDFDYVLKVVACDLKALSQFLMDTLMVLPGVDNVRSSVCLDQIKNTGALPLPR